MCGMLCVSHNLSLPQFSALLRWTLRCLGAYFQFLFETSLVRFSIVSIMSLDCFPHLEPLTVSPSPCRTHNTVLEVVIGYPKVKTLGAHKLCLAWWCFTNAITLVPRVSKTLVWMQRCLAIAFVPKLGFRMYFLPVRRSHDSALVGGPVHACQTTWPGVQIIITIYLNYVSPRHAS